MRKSANGGTGSYAKDGIPASVVARYKDEIVKGLGVGWKADIGRDISSMVITLRSTVFEYGAQHTDEGKVHIARHTLDGRGETIDIEISNLKLGIPKSGTTPQTFARAVQQAQWVLLRHADRIEIQLREVNNGHAKILRT